MNTVSKTCPACKVDKPLASFYKRSGMVADDNPGHYLTECKSCMKLRSKNEVRLPVMVARTETEILACDYLHKNGIPALPGKSVGYADVDVAAFGCVPIEIKYSALKYARNQYRFNFSMSAKQVERGFLADIVILICNWEGYPERIEPMTYHIFKASNPVFYMGERVKNTLLYVPGQTEAIRKWGDRIVMVDSMMESAQDHTQLIWQRLKQVSQQVACGDLSYQRFSAMDKINKAKG